MRSRLVSTAHHLIFFVLPAIFVVAVKFMEGFPLLFVRPFTSFIIRIILRAKKKGSSFRVIKTLHLLPKPSKILIKHLSLFENDFLSCLILHVLFVLGSLAFKVESSCHIKEKVQLSQNKVEELVHAISSDMITSCIQVFFILVEMLKTVDSF